jgi:hypothetical protein
MRIAILISFIIVFCAASWYFINRNFLSPYIAKSFSLDNHPFEKASKQAEQRTSGIRDSILKIYRKDSLRNSKWMKNAEKAKKLSDGMFNYVQSIKEILANRCGGWLTEDKTAVNDDRNLEVSGQYFLKEGHGKKLRDSLKSFVKTMELLSEHAVHTRIDTDDPSKSKDGDQKSWEEYYWEGVPSIAAITELTKFQNDIRTAEGDVTTWLYSKVK